MSDGSLESGRLRMDFHRTGDRLAHRIWLKSGPATAAAGPSDPLEETLLLESLEGTNSEDWPASPPWQQLDWHSLPGRGQAALLVGLAGRSHWSASIEPVKCGWVLDIACRVKSAPQGCRLATRLGSSYRLVAARELVALGDAPGTNQAAPAAVEITALSPSPKEFSSVPGSPPIES